MESINNLQICVSRRNVVKLLLAAPTLLLKPSLVFAEMPKGIQVNIYGVTDVPNLILAIRKAAGNLLPGSIKDEVFHAEFARVFISNARAAYEQGFNIPKWILEKLPPRRIFFVITMAMGVIILMINGAPFIVAVETVMSAVLASIVVMSSAIVEAIDLAKKPNVLI